MAHDSKPLIRLVAPKYPPSVFSWIRQPPLGLVMVATVAKNLGFYEIEIYDENNCGKYLNKDGSFNHKKLQKERPAQVVALSGVFTCAIERVYEIAKFYKSQGVLVIAGGKHVENCPKKENEHNCAEEALKNGIDIVVRGEGEEPFGQVLIALHEGKSFENIPGISFRGKDGTIKHNPRKWHVGGFDQKLEDLPCPDFSLFKDNRKIKVAPICRVRLCNEGCEFCSVRGNPHWASPEKFVRDVDELVSQGFKSFFIVDDNSAKDWPGYIVAFRMIAKKYGRKIRFMVQARQDVAENDELIRAMHAGGVRWIAVGCESPYKDELIAMNKGYGPENMVRNIRKLREWFNIYAMFIYGYPVKGRKITIEGIVERMRTLVEFIRETGVEAIQIFHPGVAVGSVFRRKQAALGAIFEKLPWHFYTGDFLTFLPSEDIDEKTLNIMQRIPGKIMSRFYRPTSIISDAASLVVLLTTDHKSWRLEAKKYWIKSAVKLLGWRRVARKWGRGDREKEFFERIHEYLRQKKDPH